MLSPSSSSAEGLWEGGAEKPVWAAGLQKQQETWRWQGLSAAPASLHPDGERGWDLLLPDFPLLLQTVADCVLYYYLTKKNENYKNLVRRNYRRRGKSQVRAGGARGNVVPRLRKELQCFAHAVSQQHFL